MARLEDITVGSNVLGIEGTETILKKAKDEILKYNEELPRFLDPFAGGGALPLEAQRLGLESYSHDLNPLPVIINMAMTDIPFRFANISPVNPIKQEEFGGNGSLIGLKALSNDVEYYSYKLLENVRGRLSYLYPDLEVINGREKIKKPVVAWIWTRTTRCPNPACNHEMPLASSFILSKKKGNEYWVEPTEEEDGLKFIVHHGKCPKERETLKMGKGALFKCPFCGVVTTDEYVKTQGKANKISCRLMAIAVNGKSGREYYPATCEQEYAADIEKPVDYPSGSMPKNPRWFSPPAFGLADFADIFTNRQLVALTTFSDSISTIEKQIEGDAIRAGMENDHISLSNNGIGAKAYAEAIGVYLSFLVDKLASINTNVCQWEPMAQCPRIIFGRQAIPMLWDFAESNPIGHSSGSFEVLINGLLSVFGSETFDFQRDQRGYAEQFDAQIDCGMRNVMVSTDPPYYDNIGYADLSDFFYIWLRRSLHNTFPELFSTMLAPKKEELIATPYRFEGSMDKAKQFFEEGMLQSCKQIYKYASDDIPVTIYYAYKQSTTDKDNKRTLSGWETMLTAIINAGFSITGTWPLRTEMTSALKTNVNALASSVVLVCRKRKADAPQATRRTLVNILRRELRPALKKLQESNIAPVDLAQSAIGPGMGVFSKYRRVLEADGSEMSVRSALQLINEEVDLYFNEQVGDLDPASRFCVDLYTQTAYNDIKYGEAEVLANAKGTSIPMMASHGVLYAKAGIVHLVERKDLPEKIDIDEKNIWLLTQQLTQAMETGGVEKCAQIIAPMFGSNAESAKDLAYRLYTIAEQKNWAQEAYAYNALVVAWPDIQSRAAALKAQVPKQMSLFDYMPEGN